MIEDVTLQQISNDMHTLETSKNKTRGPIYSMLAVCC